MILQQKGTCSARAVQEERSSPPHRAPPELLRSPPPQEHGGVQPAPSCTCVGLYQEHGHQPPANPEPREAGPWEGDGDEVMVPQELGGLGWAQQYVQPRSSVGPAARGCPHRHPPARPPCTSPQPAALHPEPMTALQVASFPVLQALLTVPDPCSLLTLLVGSPQTPLRGLRPKDFPPGASTHLLQSLCSWTLLSPGSSPSPPGPAR